MVGSCGLRADWKCRLLDTHTGGLAEAVRARKNNCGWWRYPGILWRNPSRISYREREWDLTMFNCSLWIRHIQCSIADALGVGGDGHGVGRHNVACCSKGRRKQSTKRLNSGGLCGGPDIAARLLTRGPLYQARTYMCHMQCSAAGWVSICLAAVQNINRRPGASVRTITPLLGNISEPAQICDNLEPQSEILPNARGFLQIFHGGT